MQRESELRGKEERNNQFFKTYDIGRVIRMQMLNFRYVLVRFPKKAGELLFQSFSQKCNHYPRIKQGKITICSTQSGTGDAVEQRKFGVASS